MDLVTGAHVSVGLIVPVPRERMWELITAVERIGEWSPEVVGAKWCAGVKGPAPGARFDGRNRFPNGVEATVACVVTAAEPPTTFAWTTLDADGLTGSIWRYELREGNEPGSTLVQHSFTHGPGNSGARAEAQFLDDRLVTLCRNMATTIAAMAAPHSPIAPIGAAR